MNQWDLSPTAILKMTNFIQPVIKYNLNILRNLLPRLPGSFVENKRIARGLTQDIAGFCIMQTLPDAVI